MRTRESLCAAATALGLFLWTQPAPAVTARPEIMSAADANPEVEVTNVGSENGVISGVVINRSPEPVRDVRVLIDHVWYWNNERHPGDFSPGRSEFYTIQGAIPPGGSLPFRFESSPLPQRADGHFETMAHVTEFTQIGTMAADQPRPYERPGAYGYPSAPSSGGYPAAPSTGEYPSGRSEPPARY